MPEVRRRTMSEKMGAGLTRTLVGTGRGAGVVPTLARVAAAGASTRSGSSVSIHGAEGVKTQSGVASAGALTESWGVPLAGNYYNVAVTGYVASASVTGTADLVVNGQLTTIDFGTGPFSYSRTLALRVEAGATINATLTPTFGGGGTVSLGLQFTATRAT